MNNDFRGYLQSNPGTSWLNGFVGNDGGIDFTKQTNGLFYNPDTYGYRYDLGYGSRAAYSPDEIKGIVGGLYDKWQGGQYQAGAQGDASTAQFYNDSANQLEKQLGQLDGQQNIGLDNIANSFNLSANRLDEQNAVAKRNYDTSSQQNTQGYLNNRNGILTNTRNTVNALQRLLGLNGAGNSSAAYESAPYAAGLQGTQDLTKAQTTYGNNASSLDTNWQDTQRNYGNAFEDLKRQRYQNENSLKSSIASTRAGLLDKIGQAKSQAAIAAGAGYSTAQAARAPYQSQIDSLLSQITQLGQQYANPVMRTADVSFNAPSLAGYSLSRNFAPSTNGGAASNLDGTFLNLLAGQRDRYGNIIQ